MNIVTQLLLDSTDWARLRTDSGTGGGLPQAVRELAAADTDAAAQHAYWQIDNEVVVQGELHEAAEPLLQVLLSLVGCMSSPFGRRSVVELIQQIVCSEVRESERILGNSAIADRCRAAAVEAVWMFYSWLSEGDTDIVECALLIIDAVDTRLERKQAVLSAMSCLDLAPGVQRVLRQLGHGNTA